MKLPTSEKVSLGWWIILDLFNGAPDSDQEQPGVVMDLAPGVRAEIFR